MNLAHVIHTSILETWDQAKKRTSAVCTEINRENGSDAHFQLEWQEEDPHP